MTASPDWPRRPRGVSRNDRRDGLPREANPHVSRHLIASPQWVTPRREPSQGGDPGSNPVCDYFHGFHELIRTRARKPARRAWETPLGRSSVLEVEGLEHCLVEVTALDGQRPNLSGGEATGARGEPESNHSARGGRPGTILQDVNPQRALVGLFDSECLPKLGEEELRHHEHTVPGSPVGGRGLPCRLTGATT
jgi:hypothetical protein